MESTEPRRVSRRTLLQVMVVGSAGALLAACQGAQPAATSAPPKPTTPAAPAAAPSAAPAAAPSAAPGVSASPSAVASTGGVALRKFPAGTSIKVMVSSGHQQFNPVWDRLGEFQSLTNIQVNLDKVATTDIETKLTQDLKVGGCTYDAAEVLDGAMAGLASNMAPLEPFFQKDGMDVNAFKQNLAPWAVKAATYENQLKYYLYYSGGKAIAYRKNLLEDPKNKDGFKAQFGYDLPIPATTPQQVLDLAKYFTRDGMWGLVMSGKGDSAETGMADLAFRSGVPGYTDEKNNALWGPKHPENQTKITSTASWYQGLIYKDKVAPPESTGMGTGEAVSFYTSGKAAMIYDTFYLSWAEFNKPNVLSTIGESGSFEMPSFQQGAGGIPFWWGYALPACSKNPDAAWEFVKWIMSDENIHLALTKGLGVFVPTLQTQLDWAVQQNVVPAGVAETVRHAQYYTITPVTGVLRQKINIPAVETLLQNQTTPDQYIQQVGSQMQAALEQAGVVQG